MIKGLCLLSTNVMITMTKMLLTMKITPTMMTYPRAQIEAGYKLHYNAELPEDCGSAPCAGNSLHCQLMDWSHWVSYLPL